MFSWKKFHIWWVTKLFKSKIKLLPKRPGERFASALTNMNLSNKVYRSYGEIKLLNYINNFLENNNITWNEIRK